MCGINGIVSFNGNNVAEESLRQMMEKQKHRGPDDEGIYIEDNVGLGFVRLSILDLTYAGHQPMITPDGRYVIVFNGEIYNYIELREELIKKGFVFRSNSDTEVLLNSYLHWGADCLNRFNGMWAFVIYDKNEKQLFCARDRFGIKPFYYSLTDEKFVFASEIPPLLSQINYQKSVNESAIFDYFVFNRTDQNEHTFFNGIKKLQHGQFLLINLNETGQKKIIFKRWYDLSDRVYNNQPLKSAGEFGSIFDSSISLRLRSDVPVGVCLSGGLDSSSIVGSLYHRYNLTNINTFSAVYSSGQTGDESQYINEFAPYIKNMHFTYPTGESLLEDLDRFVNAHAELVPSTGPYAQFKVMELAKEFVKVTLDGQGADEYLAGYHYFYGNYFKGLFYKREIKKLIKEVVLYLKTHNSTYGLKSFIYFMFPESQQTRIRLNKNNYLESEFTSEYSYSSNISKTLYKSDGLNDALLNHFEYKLEHLLKWEDRNSMHFSLEARVPFLDYRLVEKTLASKEEFKINDGITKFILREAMKDIVPETIINRKDKTGFNTPQDMWFRSKNWQTKIFDILTSQEFRNMNIVNPEQAILQYRRHIKGKSNISKDIWKWVNLDTWHRTYFR